MYNRVIIMGRLTADPELRQTQSGVSCCRISIAVDRSHAKQGEEKKTDFFNVVCWRNAAEFVCRYFGKGKMIHIEGKLRNNNYEDQNGVKHCNTEIIADGVAFCGDKSQNTQKGAQQANNGGYSGSPKNYTPNSGTANNAAQMAQNGYYQQQPVQIGNLDEFEEVPSDGEVPF